MTTSWIDLLSPLVGAAIGSLIALLGGWLREREATARYRLHLQAEEQRIALLAKAPAAARDEIDRYRHSQPPAVGPLAALVAMSLAAGVGGGVVAPRAVASLRQDSTAMRCTYQNCVKDGGTCVNGKCQKSAETEEASHLPHSDVSPALLDPVDPADLSAREPPS